MRDTENLDKQKRKKKKKFPAKRHSTKPGFIPQRVPNKYG